MIIGKVNKAVWAAIFLWGLSLCNAWAAYHLTGVVRDRESKEPIAGAFVLAYTDNTQRGFAYSSADGQFSIQIQDGIIINTIRVSMMGYAPVSITTDGRTSGFVIELKEQALQLSSAAVKSHSINRKGDTLSFYVQAFTDGTEQVLDDLVNKIPGLNTNESGAITYDGEAINRFYIEGLDLMGSKYGVVTKNLKASDIARIDVYLNHQPINALRDISPSERSAVNIILKENARGSWVFTGDALVGLPPFPLFDAKAMVSRFGKTSQDLYLLKGNNLGKDITQELREQPGVNDSPRVFLVNGNLDNQFSSPLDPSFSNLPVPREYWYDNLSGIATFNHLSKIGENGKLRLSFNAAAEKYAEQSFSSETVIFDDGASMTIDDSQSLTDRKYYFQGQATYEDNGPNRFLSESFSLSGQFRNDYSDGSGRNDYDQYYNLPSLKANNDLRLTFRHGKKAIGVTSTITFIRNSHSATYHSGNHTYDQTYLQNDLSSRHGASLEIAKGRHSISANVGIDLDYLDRDAALTSSSDLVETLSTPAKNRLSVFVLRPSLSLRDVINLGRFTFSASLPVALNILQIRNRSGSCYPSLSPALSVRYTPTANLSAIAGVSYSLQRSSPESLLDAVVMRNYRSLSLPDSLSRSDRFTARASIRYADPIGMLFANISGSYGQMIRDKTSSYKYLPDLTITDYVPLQNTTSMYNVDGNIRKYFGGKVFMIEGSAGYDVTEMDEYLQQVPIHYTTRRINSGIALSSSPADWFSINLQFDYTRQVTERSRANIVSHIFTGEGSMRISPLQKLDLILDGYIRREQIPNVTVFNRPLIKASISWRFSKGTVYLECNNIFNIEEYRRETVTSYRVVSTVNHLRGRQFIGGIRMSF